MKSIQWLILRILVLGPVAIITCGPARGGDTGPLYKGKSPVAWIRAVKDQHASIADASRALQMLGPKAEKCIPELLDLLRDENPFVRQLAGGGLALIGDKAVPPLLQMLESTNPAIRASSANALRFNRSGADRSAPGLRKLLKDTSGEVRHAAAVALATLHSDDAAVVSQLIDELADDIWRGCGACPW